jgi:predicted outer membrane protein
MRRGIIRWVIATLLVIMAAAFPAAGMAFASQNTQMAQVSQAKNSDTIDARDREFLTVIRFANLWEIPMGKLGTERGTTDAVKAAGQRMLTDHTNLNVVVKQLADKYGVQLPDKPTSSQQSWIAEISSKQGRDFDKSFANRLRAAHGTVFGLVAEERAGTRNAVLRDFATQANNIVMTHMNLLEKTGYVTDDHGMFAEAAARTTAYPENTLTNSSVLVAGVIFLIVAAGTVLGVRTLSARGAAK